MQGERRGNSMVPARMTQSRRSRTVAFALCVLLLTEWSQARRAHDQSIQLTPAQRAIAHGTLPLTNFYDTVIPLPPGEPGDLIRSQPFDDYDLPEGVSAFRILYHSLAATGADVAASGVVLIPRGDVPKRGWPVIAWAHPFIGVARTCAPSLMRSLDSGSVLSMYVNLGYAVVATDYVGLGTSFRNASFDAQSNASDVINLVKAARKAVPQLGTRWVAIGEADGGRSALFVSELQNQTEDQNYLGSVSISGGLDLRVEIEQLWQGNWQDRFAFLAYGIKTDYPAFRLGEMLTPKGQGRYETVTQTCSPPAAEATLLPAETLRQGWQTLPSVKQFLLRNSLGSKPSHVPLLVISAEDPKVSADAKVVTRMCGQKDRIMFETYPGLHPNDLFGTSIATQLSWIKARFDGRMTPNACR